MSPEEFEARRRAFAERIAKEIEEANKPPLPPPNPSLPEAVAVVEKVYRGGIDAIFEKSAECYGLAVSIVKSKSRTIRVMKARQVVAYILRMKCRWSYPAIAAGMGASSHSTAMTSVRIVAKAMGHSPKCMKVKRRGKTDVELPKGQRPEPIAVIDLVAKFYGVQVAEILGPRTFDHVCWARQVAMVMVHKLCGAGVGYVGSIFNRDHTTVCHAKRHVLSRTDRAKELGEVRKTIFAALIQTNQKPAA